MGTNGPEEQSDQPDSIFKAPEYRTAQIRAQLLFPLTWAAGLVSVACLTSSDTRAQVAGIVTLAITTGANLILNPKGVPPVD
jgi:hypothetical protein